MRRFILLLLVSLTLSAYLFSLQNVAAKEQGESDRPRRATTLGWGTQAGYFGMDVQEVEKEDVSRLKLAQEQGALVTSVREKGPAAQAGLKKDDVIVRWNGEPVQSTAALMRLRNETPAGRTVRLGVLRDGKEIELDVKLGEPEGFGASWSMAPSWGAAPSWQAPTRVAWRGRLGVQVQELSPQLADYFGLSGRAGVLVTSVEKDSAAGRAGLRAGDVILSVGGESTDSAARVSRALTGKGEGPVEVKILRNRQEQTISVQLEKVETGRGWPLFQGNQDWFVGFPPLDPIVIDTPMIEVPRFVMPEVVIPYIELPNLPVMPALPALPAVPWRSFRYHV